MEDNYMEIHDMFKQLGILVRHKIRKALKPLKLRGVEFRFLKFIQEGERLTISEISKRLCKHKSNTTNIIDSLEKKNYIKRVNDENDRRIIRIVYTKSGKAKRKKILEQYHKCVVDLLSDVPENILDKSHTTLKYFIDKFNNID